LAAGAPAGSLVPTTLADILLATRLLYTDRVSVGCSTVGSSSTRPATYG
jgi:hypothetical protein